MTPSRFRLFALVALCLAAAPLQALGTEWFVAAGAAGNGTATAPFGRIQQALNVAMPGDVVSVRPGTYAESIRTVRNGVDGAPITIRALGGRGFVLVSASGRVLTVDHENIIVDGLMLDGQYGADDTVRVSSGGNTFTLRNAEVRRSSRDLIDMGAPYDVLVEGCLIHHALNPVDGRSDAHGIVAGAVRRLTIRDTEIHTFSGDGFQVDSGRAAPGWTDVLLERNRIWLAPLATDENGYAAGVVPGENAVDTKASPSFARATIHIRDTEAWGFRNGLITNMAAFNIKEHVDAVIDRVTVHDSEIAFRLRGAPSGGAWVALKNAVVYDVATAIRYEDDIQNLRIWNSTIGNGVGRVFQAAASKPYGLTVLNTLILGQKPAEAAHQSNLAVGPSAFVDDRTHDYRLSSDSAAVDAGVSIVEVNDDRAGTRRPQGEAFDVGAYELERP
nr:putative secreted sugar hydrolase [uncultured bacterium]